jgi:pseudouridine-5'-phosphate glycosidase
VSLPEDILHVAPEVRDALAGGRPVVALESSVWCQGLPQPVGYEAALEAETIVRAEGAVPAILAVRDGRLYVGLSHHALAEMCESKQVHKVSLRDLPSAVALRQWGATTVSASLWMCHAAGIRVFSTGGIGGVHRHSTWDVSTDLGALGRFPIAVVCSGAKSLLDIPATLERLETEGVAIIGYQTDCFPVFYTRTSSHRVTATVPDVQALSQVLATARAMQWPGAVLVVQPVPREAEIPGPELEAMLAEALAQAGDVHGKDVTPFILGYLHQHSNGRTLEANRALLRENARLAARIK